VTRLRSSLRVLVIALMLAGAAAVAAPAGGAWAQSQYPLDPAANIPAPASFTGWACRAHPLASKCEGIVVHALNHARSVMGEPSYQLPVWFKSLTGAEQLLVLSNQDRGLYRRKLIIGMNATLNTSARRAANHGGDPQFVDIGGTFPTVGGSNWAGGMASPLIAYYLWMYVDGVASGNSGNVACRQPGDAACWGHRNATLMGVSSSHDRLVMGIGHGTESGNVPAWTELYEAFGSGVPLTYVPTVTGLSSRSDTAAGGSTVTISGFGFGRVTSVTFGATPARYTVVSSTTIRAVAPAGVPGRTHVLVTTRGGRSRATAAAAFTYV
jgi:hypothetical protein